MTGKLPPYAKQAIKRKDWPQQRCIWVYMGWSKYRPHYEGAVLMGANPANINVVIPDDETPNAFRWDWVGGRDVVIIGKNDQEPRIDQLTPLLALAGTEQITWLASSNIIPIRVARREAAA